jgi:hypothetical protein
MERLDVIVARVLAGVSVAIEEGKAGARTRDLSRPGSGPRAKGEDARGVKGDRLSSRTTVRRGCDRRRMGAG